jgi:hypothetical protein
MIALPDPLKLRDFLTGLARELRNLNRPDIAEKLETANAHFQLPPSSEFLLEAVTALQHAVETGLLPRNAQERAIAYLQAIKAQSFSLPS